MSSAERRLVVAIDGPAASGKSSTARMVAELLGARHLDSGLLYRAATAARLREGGDPALWTEASVLESVRRVELRPGPTTFTVCIDGADCDSEARGEPVTRAVSLVAKMPRVRAWVNGALRAAARGLDVVVDGRDMGAAVFPDAALKVWLDALPSERARRRILQRTGREPTPAELESETAELEARDSRDREQTRAASDAFLIDGTRMTQAEQVGRIVLLAREARGPAAS